MWEKVDGPDKGNGCYTDRLRIPGGWLYRVEEWGSGGADPVLVSRQLVFVSWNLANGDPTHGALAQARERV